MIQRPVFQLHFQWPGEPMFHAGNHHAVAAIAGLQVPLGTNRASPRTACGRNRQAFNSVVVVSLSAAIPQGARERPNSSEGCNRLGRRFGRDEPSCLAPPTSMKWAMVEQPWADGTFQIGKGFFDRRPGRRRNSNAKIAPGGWGPGFGAEKGVAVVKVRAGPKYQWRVL